MKFGLKKRASLPDSPKLKCPFQEEPHVQVYRGAKSLLVLFLAGLRSLPVGGEGYTDK